MKIIWSPKKTGQQKGIKKKARGTRRKTESVSTIRINQKEDPRTEKGNGKINERRDKLKKVEHIHPSPFPHHRRTDTNRRNPRKRRRRSLEILDKNKEQKEIASSGRDKNILFILR